MGYVRFFRRVRLAPGISLNLSGGGPSVSFGVRGAHMTLGRSGVRRTVGIPWTGLFYTSRQGWHSGVHSSPAVHGNQGAEPGATVLVWLVVTIVVVFLWAIAR
jgi:hypothetical protein